MQKVIRDVNVQRELKIHRLFNLDVAYSYHFDLGRWSRCRKVMKLDRERVFWNSTAVYLGYEVFENPPALRRVCRISRLRRPIRSDRSSTHLSSRFRNITSSPPSSIRYNIYTVTHARSPSPNLLAKILQLKLQPPTLNPHPCLLNSPIKVRARRAFF